jgi:hypothetical protein
VTTKNERPKLKFFATDGYLRKWKLILDIQVNENDSPFFHT